ncbi:hypothetical protein ACS04_00080 [Streptomyces roseus]|uniref:Uncharacterized protein n=1 Tax=Streptomyces roseus TaxID=66430 RepID=A0A0J7ARG2_9ACTN|nr:hypothetical protein ACS04_00080 [Streptomyces roseus]
MAEAARFRSAVSTRTVVGLLSEAGAFTDPVVARAAAEGAAGAIQTGDVPAWTGAPGGAIPLSAALPMPRTCWDGWATVTVSVRAAGHLGVLGACARISRAPWGARGTADLAARPTGCPLTTGRSGSSPSCQDLPV